VGAYVIALRSKADFQRAGALPPESLEVTYRTPDDPELPTLMKRAAALVLPAVGPKLPPTLFERTTIRLAQVTGAGVDRLDREALAARGIPVANVPGGSNSAVAEYVLAAASVLLRRLSWADHEVKAGNYEGFRSRMVAENLGGIDGCTVGVVGLGMIGYAVARAFKTRGANIVYFDTRQREPAELAAIEASPATLDELLAMSDVVTIHVPLLDTTRLLIGAAELARMKPGAVFINASRGGVVDENALVNNLESGRLGGAAIDVYSTEPPPKSNPLLAASADAARRLLLTPHIAGVTRQSWSYLFKASWNNVERVVRGEQPLNRVY
jgi:phosphoglycerate dehydrogenase-like enzyme